MTKAPRILPSASLGRYYGDLQWYAPDGVDGDRKDTLLIIAVKINNAKLVEWMLSLDGLDTTKQNGKGMNAMAVAKALGREHLLLGMSSPHAPSDATKPGVQGAAGATSAASAATGGDAPPLPPSKAAEDEAGLEIARLGNAIKMLKVTIRVRRIRHLSRLHRNHERCAFDEAWEAHILVKRISAPFTLKMYWCALLTATQANNDEKEAKIAQAERDCQAYQQMLKEKDANIGELQKKVGV